MQGNRNFQALKNLIKDNSYKNLPQGQKEELLKYAVSKGANPNDIRQIIREKESGKGGLFDFSKMNFSKIDIKELVGFTAKEKAASHGATLFPQLYGLIHRQGVLLIPIDVAIQGFTQITGINLNELDPRGDIIKGIIAAHTIDQKHPLEQGKTYKTNYGNSITFTGEKIITGPLTVNVLSHEVSGEKKPWYMYYIDGLLIPGDLLYKIRQISIKNPEQPYTYLLSKELADKIDKDLYNRLRKLGVDSVIDPLQFQVAKGFSPDGSTIWINSNGGSYTFKDQGVSVTYNNGILDAYEDESDEYLELLREKNDPRYKLVTTMFRHPDFAKLSEPEQLQFIDNLLNSPNSSIDRKAMLQLYDRLKLYNFVDQNIGK